MSLVDGFCQLERPVVWRTFLGTVDGDFNAIVGVFTIGGERARLDLVSDQQRGRRRDAAHGGPTAR
ncbi:hypothetical protein D3C75_1235210 [compost metagenome]